MRAITALRRNARVLNSTSRRCFSTRGPQFQGPGCLTFGAAYLATGTGVITTLAHTRRARDDVSPQTWAIAVVIWPVVLVGWYC